MFVTKRANGYYYLYFNVEGSGKRKMISCKTKKKPEALKFLCNLQNNFNTSHTKQTVLYLTDLQNEILKYVNDNLRHGTVKIYKSTLKHLLRIVKDKPIKLITSNEIEYYKSIRLKEVRQSTVNIDLNTIKAIFNIAIRFNWLEKNPSKDIKKISIPQKQRLCFNEIETKLILNNCNPLIKNLVSFALYTGMRLNEICNVQMKDVNYAEGILSVSNKETFKTKTGRQRQIPTSENLINLIKAIKNHKSDKILPFYAPEHYLFSIRGGFKLSPNFVSKAFKKVLRKLSMSEKFHFHCLRHTFITNLIKAGVNINYVKEIAGHKDIKTTMGYIHIVTEDLREAVNKIKIC